MADFRKMFYALALVAIFVTLSIPAAAQGLVCTNGNSGSQVVRREGFAEQLGDIVLTCTNSGATSTTTGATIPSSNIRLQINGGSSFTSKVTDAAASGNDAYVEALIIFDEFAISPQDGASGAAGRALYCGTAILSPSVNGTCTVKAPLTATPANGQAGTSKFSYDGNPGSAGVDGMGRPNIFHGRVSAALPNEIYFPNIPLDPPVSGSTRTIRITNLRANATVFPADSGAASNVNVTVLFEGAAAVSLASNVITIGYVKNATGTTAVTLNTSAYTVCMSAKPADTTKIIIPEAAGFDAAFRPRNLKQFSDNLTGTTYVYDTTKTVAIAAGSTDTAQATPGTKIYSETGFFMPTLGSAADVAVEHGIRKAGQANTGTQLQFTQGGAPTGVTITWPAIAYVYLGAAGSKDSAAKKGLAFLVSVNGVATLGGDAAAKTTTIAGTIVYEIAFADPFQRESVEILPTTTYTLNTVTVNSYPAGTLLMSSVILGPSVVAATKTPGFNTVLAAAATPLIDMANCSCNLLFPWVTSTPEFGTGIAISNTSKDPTNAVLSPVVPGYTALAQTGLVNLYLFGTGVDPGGAANATVVAKLQATSASVAAGTGTTFSVAGLSGNFQGYAIAQAKFQYCHGLALVYGTTSGFSFSYLGLVMDGGASGARLDRLATNSHDGMLQ